MEFVISLLLNPWTALILGSILLYFVHVGSETAQFGGPGHSFAGDFWSVLLIWYLWFFLTPWLGIQPELYYLIAVWVIGGAAWSFYRWRDFMTQSLNESLQNLSDRAQEFSSQGNWSYYQGRLRQSWISPKVDSDFIRQQFLYWPLHLAILLISAPVRFLTRRFTRLFQSYREKIEQTYAERQRDIIAEAEARLNRPKPESKP